MSRHFTSILSPKLIESHAQILHQVILEGTERCGSVAVEHCSDGSIIIMAPAEEGARSAPVWEDGRGFGTSGLREARAVGLGSL